MRKIEKVKRKAFIHHDGALGDMLLSLPCIRMIRDNSDFVHMAGPPDVAELLREIGYVHETSPAGSALFTSLHSKEIERAPLDFLEQFDYAVVFTRRRDSPFAVIIEKVIPHTEIIITIPPEGLESHVAQFRLNQLALGGESIDLKSKITIPSPYREKAKEFFVRSFGTEGRGPLIAFHPGSGGKRKCWPLRNYFRLVEKLLNRQACRVLFLTGPAEEPEVADDILGFAHEHIRVVHVRNEPLIMVASLLAACDLYVGNDSGISHLGAAVSGKVIVLFGPTDPLLWKPTGTGVEVISAGISEDSLAGVSVDEIYERLTFRLEQAAQEYSL
jgi:ADP-heptose:LPS heptosyltransferase